VTSIGLSPVVESSNRMVDVGKVTPITQPEYSPAASAHPKSDLVVGLILRVRTAIAPVMRLFVLYQWWGISA